MDVIKVLVYNFLYFHEIGIKTFLKLLSNQHPKNTY